MQIIVTHGSLAKTRVMNLPGWQLATAAAILAAVLLLASGIAYHFLVLTAARDGWPVVSQIVKFVVRDEIAQRDRVMRENLDAMASRVGELQAKLVKLESIGERVSGMAGLKAEDFRGLDRATPMVGPASGAGRGGPFVPVRTTPAAVIVPTLDQLNAELTQLDENADHRSDVFTLIESRLLESRLRSLLVPSSAPVEGPVGSGFGFRLDPFTGRGALHTGLDFPADPGSAILAAAGGVVLSTETHPAYGRTVELDHGNGLVTRYAHASKIVVADGDLIRRGQKIAEVGSSGRSTGPHLHFEVLVEGVPQDPAKFLAQAGRKQPAVARGATGEAFGAATAPADRREATARSADERATDRREATSVRSEERRRPAARAASAQEPGAASQGALLPLPAPAAAPAVVAPTPSDSGSDAR
jgi:murein DD-endopeptidase MepM/ murein hydrolase activator NlpD